MPAPFPFADRPRLFGVAVSHYQVEGNDPCDWTDWESAGRTRGGPCGRAAGSWERYEEDAEAAASLGANAFRFSVSWSRVEPRKGKFDEAALERYARLVVRLDALGLEPVVTLLHYTHPRWFHAETPWTSTASVDAFARFAARTARALGPKARCWTVLNEPLVLVLGGFLDGQVPPGIASASDAARALDHLLAAHEAAAAQIRAAVPGAAIGVAHNMMGFAPERARNPFDRALVSVANRFYNQTLLDAFGEGRWSAYLPPFTRFAGKRPGLPASLDFFGVNFYSRLHLRFLGDGGRIGSFAYRDPLGRGLTDNGWEVVPEAFLPLLRQAASLGKPLLVTENGLADAADTKRAAFLEFHVAVLQAAEAEGLPVHGYLHWSLVDNYEWLDGWEPRFGLLELDRETLARRERPSARTFRRLASGYLGRPLPSRQGR
ncbi:MAG: glycoside hydrolase family 1 protein [Holophagales bacterium]|nr:glycoside hydrolase family 1 protein [Holophagales bacterium]